MPFKEGETPMEKSQPASFEELAKQKNVTPAELIATLRDYAERGADFDFSGQFLGILRRVTLNPEDKETLAKLAKTGIDKAIFSTHAAEYRSITRWLVNQANLANSNQIGERVKKILAGNEKK